MMDRSAWKRQLNGTIDQWIDLANKYDFNTLLRRPGDESWSLGQVAMHIDAETGFYIAQAEICLHSNENAGESMTGPAKVMFDNHSFPDIRIKRDDTLSQNYPQPISRDDLHDRMKKSKVQLNDLLERTATSAGEGKTKHPGLGYFNAKEWLQFAEMHMRHHLRQKDRIESELNRG